MNARLMAPMLVAAGGTLLPEVRENPESFGLRMAAAIGSALPLAGGGLADYDAVATALETAAEVLRDASHGVPRAVGLG